MLRVTSNHNLSQYTEYEDSIRFDVDDPDFDISHSAMLMCMYSTTHTTGSMSLASVQQHHPHSGSEYNSCLHGSLPSLSSQSVEDENGESLLFTNFVDGWPGKSSNASSTAQHRYHQRTPNMAMVVGNRTASNATKLGSPAIDLASSSSSTMMDHHRISSSGSWISQQQQQQQQQQQDHNSNTVMTIEELRSQMLSCFTCGVAWCDSHISLDCRECGGYALERPCPLCDGKCGAIWKRDLSLSHSSRNARWQGKCHHQEVEPQSKPTIPTNCNNSDVLNQQQRPIDQLSEQLSSLQCCQQYMKS